MRSFHSKLLVFAFLPIFLFTLVPPQAAAQDNRLGRKNPEIIEEWMDTLQKADVMLKAEEWKKARRVTNGVLREMCDSIESGKGAGELLAMAALLRAVAQAGLGNEYDAQWDWNISLALKPSFEIIDFSPYGEAGKFLAAYREHARSEKERLGKKKTDLDWSTSAKNRRPNEVIPPKKTRSPSPKFPWATHNACIEGSTVVQMIINKEGRLILPTIIQSPNAVQSFSALDQLREWRWEPAQRHGEPIEVFYNLTVNFGVPFCANPYARARKGQEGT